MAEDTRVYWIWLAELLGQGNRSAGKLIRACGDAKKIYETPVDVLLEQVDQGGFGNDTLKHQLRDRDLDRAKRIFAECQRLRIDLVTPDGPLYPPLFRTIPDPPLVLYYKGRFPDLTKQLSISIVGTRSMSDYGRTIAYALGYGLSLGGACVISGMALGTDSMAMMGAHESGGPVVALLGSGVDVIYPKEHRELYHRTIANGAVVSEYPPGTEPAGRHFPVRNRLLSGMANGTVVVEGNISSGAMITARHAISQGRKLFAVPGKIGEPGAEGPLSLLHQGALPVSTAEDVLAEFRFMFPKNININYVHAQLRNKDFERLSLTAMEKGRIGIRGESQYYGTGVYGGRIRDYRKNSHGEMPSTGEAEGAGRAEPVNTPIAEQPTHGSTEKKTAPERRPEKGSAVTKAPGSVSKIPAPGKGKGSVFNTIFEKITQKNGNSPEKTTGESQKNHNITTGFTLNSLDETDIKVYNSMKPNVPVIPDAMVTDGLDISSIMASLSVLELAGLVESAVGGYFTRLGDVHPAILGEEADGTGNENK